MLVTGKVHSIFFSGCLLLGIKNTHHCHAIDQFAAYFMPFVNLEQACGHWPYGGLMVLMTILLGTDL